MLTIIKSEQPHSDSFVYLLNEFDLQDALENSHSMGTAYKYKNMSCNFIRFLEQTDQLHLRSQDISIQTLQNFTRWLPLHLKSCNLTHISKHIYRLQRALNFAVMQGQIQNNVCQVYKVKRAKNKTVVNLTDQEFNIWVGAVWQSDFYVKAQDLYTFQMVTGLSFSDLNNYKTIQDPRTGLWIEGLRTKTGKDFAIPLYHNDFTIARQIHEKYSGKLPILENHFYNRLIREMAKILGIDKYITSHTGRKTFANRLKWLCYPDAAITGMMGNTEKVLNAHYISFSKNKILHHLEKKQA
jgi:integrase